MGRGRQRGKISLGRWESSCGGTSTSTCSRQIDEVPLQGELHRPDHACCVFGAWRPAQRDSAFEGVCCVFVSCNRWAATGRWKK